jgi:hypothetical protein
MTSLPSKLTGDFENTTGTDTEASNSLRPDQPSTKSQNSLAASDPQLCTSPHPRHQPPGQRKLVSADTAEGD